MDDLCVFTANADELLIESGRRVGIEVQSYSPAVWRGFVDGKLREGVKFLSGRHEQFAMWVDGTDSLLLKPADEILARLMVFGFPVVLAAERNCFPDPERAGCFPIVPGPRFPNAGGFIGLRNEVVTVMHQLIQHADGTEDDQRVWTSALIDKLVPVQLDHARRIFCSEGDGDTQNADPCVRHWNGKIQGRREWWEAHCK